MKSRDPFKIIKRLRNNLALVRAVKVLKNIAIILNSISLAKGCFSKLARGTGPLEGFYTVLSKVALGYQYHCLRGFFCLVLVACVVNGLIEPILMAPKQHRWVQLLCAVHIGLLLMSLMTCLVIRRYFPQVLARWENRLGSAYVKRRFSSLHIAFTLWGSGFVATTLIILLGGAPISQASGVAPAQPALLPPTSEGEGVDLVIPGSLARGFSFGASASEASIRGTSVSEASGSGTSASEASGSGASAQLATYLGGANTHTSTEVASPPIVAGTTPTTLRLPLSHRAMVLTPESGLAIPGTPSADDIRVGLIIKNLENLVSNARMFTPYQSFTHIIMGLYPSTALGRTICHEDILSNFRQAFYYVKHNALNLSDVERDNIFDKACEVLNGAPTFSEREQLRVVQAAEYFAKYSRQPQELIDRAKWQASLMKALPELYSASMWDILGVTQNIDSIGPQLTQAGSSDVVLPLHVWDNTRFPVRIDGQAALEHRSAIAAHENTVTVLGPDRFPTSTAAFYQEIYNTYLRDNNYYAWVWHHELERVSTAAFYQEIYNTYLGDNNYYAWVWHHELERVIAKATAYFATNISTRINDTWHQDLNKALAAIISTGLGVDMDQFVGPLLQLGETWGLRVRPTFGSEEVNLAVSKVIHREGLAGAPFFSPEELVVLLVIADQKVTGAALLPGLSAEEWSEAVSESAAANMDEEIRDSSKIALDAIGVPWNTDQASGAAS